MYGQIFEEKKMIIYSSCDFAILIIETLIGPHFKNKTIASSKDVFKAL